MKSLDTNNLLYAADEDCREHEAAIGLGNDALRSPAEWMAAAEKGVSPARFLAKKNVSPRPSKPRWQWLCGAIASRNHRH